MQRCVKEKQCDIQYFAFVLSLHPLTCDRRLFHLPSELLTADSLLLIFSFLCGTEETTVEDDEPVKKKKKKKDKEKQAEEEEVLSEEPPTSPTVEVRQNCTGLQNMECVEAKLFIPYITYGRQRQFSL